jgi:hypothetical protein
MSELGHIRDEVMTSDGRAPTPLRERLNQELNLEICGQDQWLLGAAPAAAWSSARPTRAFSLASRLTITLRGF